MTPSKERYAVYYAPNPDSLLWAKASAWLGRDAETGEQLRRPENLIVEPHDIQLATEKPASYGFHGTLVAPFELNENCSVDALETALLDFAKTRAAFAVRLQVDALGYFIALRPMDGLAELSDLHTELMRLSAPWQAELSEKDFARRLKGGKLNERQIRYLREWGYPFVFDDFRFHMTLTSGIADDERRDALVAALSEYFGNALSEPVSVDNIALFHQPSRDEPFYVKKRFPFKGH